MGLKSMLGGSKTESAKKRPPLRNESLREDPADEQKRIARRRLIGAVALLLLAIIILPLVLEDAPKPVSADISLHIPSRDLAVRSNPEASPPAISEESASAAKPVVKTEGKADLKADGKLETKAELKAEPPVAQKLEAKVETRAEAKSEPKVEPKVEPKAEPKMQAKPEAKPEPKATAKVETKADPKSADNKAPEPKAGKHLNVVQSDDPIASFANSKPAAGAQSGASGASSASGATNNGGSNAGSSNATAGRTNHWVQIGAFGNEGKAREMASQLRGKGYPAVTEVVRGSGGGSELYRVRVGPLETKESAGRARDNLAKAGFEGAVVQ